MKVSRRNFIRQSSLGLILLATSSSALSTQPARPQDRLWLTADDRTFFAALLPVIIDSELIYDKAILTEYINNIDTYLGTLPAVSQQEFRDLLVILSSPGKGFVTGVWGHWEKVSTTKINHFLERWRTSSISLFRKAYNSLSCLCLMKWYDMEVSWATINYPGPPYAQQLITPPNHF